MRICIKKISVFIIPYYDCNVFFFQYFMSLKQRIYHFIIILKNTTFVLIFTFNDLVQNINVI